MRPSARVAEVLRLLQEALSTLPPAHRSFLESALIAPRELPVDDFPGEFVVAVADIGGKLLYWSDVEEGWELEAPTEGGTIPTRGCNQFDLRHILHQVVGPAGAV